MSTPHEHKYEYRRKLPHIDRPGLMQSITFRLYDSLPKYVLEELGERINDSKNKQVRILREKHLNAGHGHCWLRDPRIAKLVEDALKYFDGERYELVAWVIMPNHVHVLINTFKNYPLYHVVKSWKGYTGHKANQILGRKGRYWEREYFDRYIRNDKHLENALIYIHSNPSMAGLVEKCSDWPYSSFKLYYPD